MATESDIRGLMRDYTPLAVKIANGFKRRLPGHVRLDDLRAAAMGGLWDAARLRPDADYFESYARIRISGAIKDDLRSRDWLPRLHRARFPEGVTAVVSMTETTEGSLRSDDDVESQVEANMTMDRVQAAMELLPERKRYVLVERATTGREMKDIAAELGITQARVSQIYGEAVAFVRNELAKG